PIDQLVARGGRAGPRCQPDDQKDCDGEIPRDVGPVRLEGWSGWFHSFHRFTHSTRWLLCTQERRELADLEGRQLLRILMHDGVGTEIRREGPQLPLDVTPVLPRETRKRAVTLGLLPVTGLTGHHVLRLDAVLVNLLSRGNLGGIRGRALGRRL